MGYTNTARFDIYDLVYHLNWLVGSGFHFELAGRREEVEWETVDVEILELIPCVPTVYYTNTHQRCIRRRIYLRGRVSKNVQ
jgi:hypothetical protein